MNKISKGWLRHGVAVGALSAALGAAALAGSVPNPINAPATVVANHIAIWTTTNPQQAADSGVSIGAIPTLGAALTAINSLTPAADKGLYFTSGTVAALMDFPTFGRSLVAGTTAAADRTTLGLGTAAAINTGTSGGTLCLLSSACTFSDVLTVNTGAAIKTSESNSVLQLAAAGSGEARAELVSYSNPNYFTGFRANGTRGVPTTITANSALAVFDGGAYDGTAWSADLGGFYVLANQNWAVGSHGTRSDIRATPDGSTTIATIARFYGSGGVTLGSSMTDEGSGTLNVPTAYYINNHLLNFTDLAGSVACAQEPAFTGDITKVAGSCATAVASLGAISGINLTNLNATNLASGTVACARLPALTGDVTSSAGACATTLATGSAGSLNSGTLLCARMPALTGDVTAAANGCATVLASIPAISGVNLTNLNATNLASGTVACGRLPALTGDVTSSAGSCATSWASAITATGKTITGGAFLPTTIVGGTHTAITSFGLRSTGAAFDLKFASSEVLTADRTVTWVVNDAARTITITGNVSLAGAFTTAGAFATTLTSTATTNSTLPAGTHTLAGLDVDQTWSGVNTRSALDLETNTSFQVGDFTSTSTTFASTSLQRSTVAAAAQVYRIDGWFRFTADATSGMKLKFLASGSITSASIGYVTTCDVAGSPVASGTTNVATSTSVAAGCVAGAVRIQGSITYGGGGSTILQMGLNSGTTTATIQAGGWMKFERIL